MTRLPLALGLLLALAGTASAAAVGVEGLVEVRAEVALARLPVGAAEGVALPLPAPQLWVRAPGGDAEPVPPPTLASPQAAAPAAAASLALSGLLTKFAGAFYSRIPASRLLEHPLRRSLTDLVRAEPGIPIEEARRRLGCGAGTIVHHVERLAAEGLLVTERGHGRRLYLPGSVPAAERAARAVLASDTTARVADFVAAHPGVAQKDLCAALGIAPSVASKHLAKLRRAGLVGEVREWRSARYYAAGAQPDLALA